MVVVFEKTAALCCVLVIIGKLGLKWWSHKPTSVTFWMIPLREWVFWFSDVFSVDIHGRYRVAVHVLQDIFVRCITQPHFPGRVFQSVRVIPM
jgi:hypothetical protein